MAKKSSRNVNRLKDWTAGLARKLVRVLHSGLPLIAAYAPLVLGSSTFALDQKIVAKDAVLRLQDYPGSILGLPQWVAADQGFCATHGLVCKLIPLASGPLGIQALASGSLEIAFASADVAMLARSRGLDMQLIMGHSPNNIMSLCVAADWPLPNRAAGYPALMKDFQGARVGVTARGANTETMMIDLLRGANMGPGSVTFVGVGGPLTAYAALTAKQVQAVVMFEPLATICLKQKTCVVAVDLSKGEGPADLAGLNGAFEAYYTRRLIIEKDPEAIRAFIQAMTEAMAWIQDPNNFDGVMAVARRHISLGDFPDPDVTLAELVKRTIPSYSTHIDRRGVQAWSNLLVDAKIMGGPVEVSPFIYEHAP